MSPFLIHSISLIISGIFTVFLSASIIKTHPKTGYALIVIVPLCALLLSIIIFTPEILNGVPKQNETLPPEAQDAVQKFIDNINLSSPDRL